ncbi:DNA internalization-related competence protein ComEC/Rec2 [Trichlorobacter lovleyi]|uniref:DNA internalization-related competence protein ComEC/Rec2 n=1 Tax=Trichlorobacter lovleyi TaxID=313985 RepID=UPI00223EF3B4|nr:DNA internalization-related competence protein ComEC/Rec2 [Trichlorobacter lovleyi]QOX78804.1 DNA internalization-related competence protein ComEC/Rec2 [Trichlorobacter lovleyi]
MIPERPLVIPLVFLAAGSLAEYLLVIPFSKLIPVVLLLLLVFALPRRGQTLFSCLLALFWMSWGMAALAPRLDSRNVRTGIAGYEGKQLMVEGIVVRRPTILPEGERIELQVERVFTDSTETVTSGSLLLTIAKGRGNWLTGDRIRCPVKIRIPRLLGLPGEFDYGRYLALRGIDATAWIADAESVVLMRGAARPSWRRSIDSLALRSQEFIRQSLPDAAQRGVVLALATGNQQEVPSDLAAAYTRAGVTHILSVSGFHVGVVTAVWVIVLRWLMLRWEWLALQLDLRRAVLLSTLPVMLLYLVFTGGAPATARSVFMVTVVVLAAWSEREVELLDALLLAAFTLLLYDPGVLFDLSFQLSFLSLWGLLVLTPVLTAPVEHLLTQEWQRMPVLFLAASLAAVLATMAPVLTSFHQVSFTGIAANLVVVPLLGYGATVLATVAVPLSFFMPSCAALVLMFTGWLVQLSNMFVQWIARVPVFHSFSVGNTDLVITIALLAVLGFVNSRRVRMYLGSLLLVALLLVHLWPAPVPDGKLRMTFLSVGQGDATLIQLADGRTMLVDGGGYLRDTGRDFGERYLVPALHGLKVKQIDILVLSHPHPDHLGGLPAVAEQFRVREYWQTEGSGQGADYQRLLKALAHQKTAARILHQGDRLQVGQGVLVSVLASPQGGTPGKINNDDSLVLQLQQAGFSALLMGDAGFAVEETLLKQGIGPVTVLKVGHHGSKTATGEQFLRRIRPEVAVISAGAGNSFGLPADETLERIRQQGAALYRTDQQGSIQLLYDGQRSTVGPLVAENGLVSAIRRFALTASNQLR